MPRRRRRLGHIRITLPTCLCAAYRAASERSNQIVSAIEDGDVPTKRQTKVRNVRGAILVVIEETARHAGHADIIREQIDGQTGR